MMVRMTEIFGICKTKHLEMMGYEGLKNPEIRNMNDAIFPKAHSVGFQSLKKGSNKSGNDGIRNKSERRRTTPGLMQERPDTNRGCDGNICPNKKDGTIRK